MGSLKCEPCDLKIEQEGDRDAGRGDMGSVGRNDDSPSYDPWCSAHILRLGGRVLAQREMEKRRLALHKFGSQLGVATANTHITSQ